MDTKLLATQLTEKLEQQLPVIRSIIFDKILPKITEKGSAFLADEENLIMILEKTYEMLPFALRMVVKKDTFLQFCLKHKDALLKEKAEIKPTN